jgi:hypothetical protein
MFNIETTKVNKYNAKWNPEAMFNGFNYRVLLKINNNDSMIAKTIELNKIKKKFENYLGSEFENNCIIERSPHTNDFEIYTKDRLPLERWRMMDSGSFDDNVETIEEHEA